MARIRTIKPEFFTSEDIVALTPLARLFYVSLWCEADRDGRLKWKPATLKMRYCPVDDCKVDDLALELTEKGLLRIYKVVGKKYADIPAFSSHQVINNREKKSELPEFREEYLTRESGGLGEGRKEGKERKELIGDEDKTTRSQILAKIRSLKYLQGKKPEDQEMREAILKGFETFMTPNEILTTMMENHFQITDKDTLECVMKKFVDKKKFDGQEIYDPLRDF